MVIEQALEFRFVDCIGRRRENFHGIEAQLRGSFDARSKTVVKDEWAAAGLRSDGDGDGGTHGS